MNANRRTATDADLAVDSIVYKGNGKVAFRVWFVQTRENGPALYFLQKPGSKGTPNSRPYRAAALTIEAAPVVETAAPIGPREQTGIEMIRELCSF